MSTLTRAPAGRVIAYIDGFNLYFGLRSSGWKRHYWLDVSKLVSAYLLPDQLLVATKYFTARIKGPANKKSRQDAYLEALKTLPNVSILEGKFKDKAFSCDTCGIKTQIPAEKMTDVNIATELLVDAFQDRFDTAFLVSGDSDLVPPIRHLNGIFPRKSVVVLFPPNRVSGDLKRIAKAAIHLSENHFRNSQFPDLVQRPSGGPVIQRPADWK